MNSINKYIYEEGETQEVCPNCGIEVTISTDGKSSCSECGHKEVLPCSQCKLNDEFKCDWNAETICTAFPLPVWKELTPREEQMVYYLLEDEDEEELSPCCGAPLIWGDLCSDCKEHT